MPPTHAPRTYLWVSRCSLLKHSSLREILNSTRRPPGDQTSCCKNSHGPAHDILATRMPRCSAGCYACRSQVQLPYFTQGFRASTNEAARDTHSADTTSCSWQTPVRWRLCHRASTSPSCLPSLSLDLFISVRAGFCFLYLKFFFQFCTCHVAVTGPRRGRKRGSEPKSNDLM